MDYQKVGALIATLRKEKDMTQKDLANKLGITDRAVSKWERGLGCPDVSLLDDLSRILDVSILEILKGRKLDKDEIVNNRSLIESMNYSKESIKYKMKKYFNAISIIIIVIISVIIIFANLKSIYYLNKTYYNDSSGSSDEKIFSELKNNINVIKNNQGIYSDEDYGKIVKYIVDLEESLYKQKDSYYYTKKKYRYEEMVDFYFSRQNEDLFILHNGAYELIHNYDSSVVANMIYYNEYSERIMENFINLSEQLKYPYNNNKKVSNDIVYNVSGFIYFEYYRDNMLLKDIIEVGGMDE